MWRGVSGELTPCAQGSAGATLGAPSQHLATHQAPEIQVSGL